MRNVLGFEIIGVKGYRPLNGKLLLEVRIRDNPVDVILMSEEVGQQLIIAINQASAMVQKDRLGSKDVN